MLARRKSRQYTTDPFIDLLFNALLGFTFLFLISAMLINPVSKKGRVDLKAEYIISVNWDDNSSADIDLWVQNPSGETVSYLRKEAGWLHLDRDDRGDINDKIIVNGQEVLYPINQEVITIRGIIEGEYCVNLYLYSANSDQLPVSTTVKVERVNPVLSTVFAKKLVLSKQYEEKTATCFSLNDNHDAYQFHDTPVTLTPYLLEPAQ